MAFAGYGETARRRARFRGRDKRCGQYGRGLVVLGCIPATLPNLFFLIFGSLLTVVFLATRINDHNRSVEPGSAEISSFAAVVGKGAMRVGVGGSGGEVGDVASDGKPNQIKQKLVDDSSLGPSSAFCSRLYDPLICAHGTVGASYWPSGSGINRPLPNTVPALAAAVAAGHKCIEVDVSRTKDGHLVALHSRELKPLTNNAHKNVGELTLDEILSLHIPGGGYQIATFAEAMATVMRRGLQQITIDFKEDDQSSSGDINTRKQSEPVDVVADVFGVAGRGKDTGQPSSTTTTTTTGFGLAVLSTIAMVDESGAGCPECVFWGKSDSVMIEILRENDEAAVGFTVANFSRVMLELGLDKVDARKRPLIATAKNNPNSKVVAAVQSEMISSVLKKKLSQNFVNDIFAWTVNEEHLITRVANHGVDGIVTDEPEEATRVVRAMRERCGERNLKQKGKKGRNE
ncbi:glycerophosphodiester phosphodiesterase family protein [bacterium]|nr:glycerophosphodiester phosphodiesterase family protein [bacterium]MDC1215238.1 glycerophosphodiester phosphodiesterase family protein [bacterium]